jgi:hypothetical protein
MTQRKNFKLEFSDDHVVGAVGETAALDPSGGEGLDGDSWLDDSALPVEGDIVGGHYRLVSRLGEGMFGRVYVAERTDVPKHRVALKVITRVVYAGRNVERELVMLAAASHPHIVQLKDHGMTEDYIWLSMPLYEGETLAERLERGPLSLRQAHEIFLPIVRGVHALHERGMRHQDIKPENIFLASFGRHIHPVLLDLGVAVERSASFVAGTVLYAAPEQVAALAGIPKRERLDEKIDTYCLATTLLRSLVGERHFGHDDTDTPFALAATFTRRRDTPLTEDALPELTGAPRDALIEAFRKWFACDPDERPTALEMAGQLDVLLEQEREAAEAIEAGFARQKASLQRVRLALAAMALVGAGSVMYGYSKRETLRLAGELEHARAAGKVSFGKLDTCVASHAIVKHSAASCESGRRKDESAFRSTLDEVTSKGNNTKSALARRVANTYEQLRRCEDNSENSAAVHATEKTGWQTDRAALVTVWTERQGQWKQELNKLHGDVTHAKRDIDAAHRNTEVAKRRTAKLQSQLAQHRTTVGECRQDLASCIQDRDTCMAQPPACLPAPLPAAPVAAPQKPAAESLPAPTAKPVPKPAPEPEKAPATAPGTAAAPNE